MTVHRITAAQAAADLQRFSAVLDARAPAEFAEDRLPGALNWPVLHDAERAQVGTLYKQQGALAARKVGAVLVARNVAAHLERWMADKPRDWRPLVYCWRGGQRSGALAWFLDQIGFRATQLEGGYKAFRAVVRADLEGWSAGLDLRVLAGRTGSGKTRLLQALAAEGAQVLDLEALARHRGSVLGQVPGRPQPTQKAFDTALWQAVRALDASRPVFVESESRKIGAVQLPEGLVQRMHAHGRVFRVEMPEPARVALLLEDYAFFAAEPEAFCERLRSLVPLRGHEAVARWQAQARAGDWAGVYAALMREHYDPLYLRSMDRHYLGLAQAPVVTLADGGPASLQAAARGLLAQGGAQR